MIDTHFTDRLARFLDVNVYRHSLISSNLANIDTPGYRTRDIDFRGELERAGNNLQYASFSPIAREVRGLVERPDGNNVSIDRESLLLAETQLRFNIGVQILRAEFRRVSLAINEGK
ncbi:MAG TPA: flagellar basal body protein [Terriglobales bacterium]|nr:flagellar basal body protein [Terriglobales bacterium]